MTLRSSSFSGLHRPPSVYQLAIESGAMDTTLHWHWVHSSQQCQCRSAQVCTVQCVDDGDVLIARPLDHVVHLWRDILGKRPGCVCKSAAHRLYCSAAHVVSLYLQHGLPGAGL